MRWRVSASAMLLTADVPVGTTAAVCLPVETIDAITEGGAPLVDAAGILDVRAAPTNEMSP